MIRGKIRGSACHAAPLAPDGARTGGRSKDFQSSDRGCRSAPADQVFVALVEVAARSQGRQVHLVNGCRGDSVATASTKCWATLRSTRSSERDRLQGRHPWGVWASRSTPGLLSFTIALEPIWKKRCMRRSRLADTATVANDGHQQN